VAALRAMAAPEARVVRDGRAQSVPSAALVPGDLVQLEAGDVVPADLRVLHEAELLTDESAEPGVMERPPRPPQESIFAGGMWQHILWVGLFVAGVSLASQAWSLGRGDEHWQTIVFSVLTISQLFHSIAVRSERASLIQIGLASNPAMLGALMLAFALQMAVIYVPALQPIFHTEALTLSDLAIVLALSSLVLFAVELEKWLVRRGAIYGPSPHA
jgi:Ca2+-transporting ATPase